MMQSIRESIAEYRAEQRMLDAERYENPRHVIREHLAAVRHAIDLDDRELALFHADEMNALLDESYS
jgi:hypothetical protein